VFKWIRVFLRQKRELILETMELAIELAIDRIELVDEELLVDCTEKRLRFGDIVTIRKWLRYGGDPCA